MVLALIALVFCVVDLFPHFGPPDFRYTGCDPARQVWNVGYPLALFIYDPATSPYCFVGPAVYLLIPLQTLLLAAALLTPSLYIRVRRSFRTTSTAQ